mgnify:CR=1 FL=1
MLHDKRGKARDQQMKTTDGLDDDEISVAAEIFRVNHVAATGAYDLSRRIGFPYEAS